MSASMSNPSGVAGKAPDVRSEVRGGHPGNVLILLAVGTFGSIPFIPDLLLPAAVLLVAAAALALSLRLPHAVHVTLVAATLAIVMQVPALKIASLPMILTLIVYAALVLPIASLRQSVDWFRKGTVGGRTWLHVAGIAVISSAALLAWVALARPDVSQLGAMFGRTPPWGLALMGVFLPLINATVEEFIFRGVIMSGLSRVFASALAVNLVQAVAFGLLHKDGFPSGAWGIALAGLYAFLLGWLRQRTRGLLAPWIAHVVADVTIFCIIVNIAVR